MKIDPKALAAMARSMRHASDPAAWAAEVLDWHADPWQAELLRSRDRQVVVCCSRQSGKSQTTAVLAAHTAVFQPNSLALLTSPTQRQAATLLRKVKEALSTRKLGLTLEQDAATSIELANGSRVVSLPASPDAIRGYSAPQLLVEDEAAFIEDELHLALRPMLAASPSARFILLSTPAGRAGHFFQAAHSESWRRFSVTAYDCPRIMKDFLEGELREHGDLYFAREFMCEFSDSEFSFFGSDLISAAMDCDAQPLRLRLFT